MHGHSAEGWGHDHSFGQVARQRQERRVLGVVLLTGGAMLVEIAAGWATGSMALLGDGVHMGTHAFALGLAYLAFALARRHAANREFSLGTGKIGELAGFSSALLLGVSAVLMAWEALWRLVYPRDIIFSEAILVAVLGLAVNVISAIILIDRHPHADDEASHHHHHAHDNNMRAAVLHVLADAVTSIAAIAALLAAQHMDWAWADPMAALVATGLILVWAFGLARGTGRVLIDMEAPAELRRRVTAALESDGDSRVVDLHVWSVGAGAWTLVASVVTHLDREPGEYRRALPADAPLHHPIIEVQRCR